MARKPAKRYQIVCSICGHILDRKVKGFQRCPCGKTAIDRTPPIMRLIGWYRVVEIQPPDGQKSGHK